MAQPGRPQPEQLARELKRVLAHGVRPSKMAYRIDEVPVLRLTASSGRLGTNWDAAIAICDLIKQAIRNLGDGPYARAAAALLGTTGAARGLHLPQRRRQAAAELEIQPSTFVRHYEGDILLEVAVCIYEIAQHRNPEP